ncbi:DUF5994 family protein [Frankia sp. R82]|uniref:DUF5994 family protein n=1 Tax=Frankia sp. R82 TaxID=2950553 RepID=UPI002042E027|nr:DUF5994 family protein [Frankia sp. R82]MCM3884436.1 DUF5994 family protein [Frankia sp. R82]
MTALQVFSPFDRVDLDRFDDDGGALGRPKPSAASPAPGSRPVVPAAQFSPMGNETRLSLARTTPGQALPRYDGSWWPRSLNLAAELPELLAALARAGRTVARMSVNGDAWTDIPTRFARPGLPPLRVSWYRTLDPRVVTLGAGTRPWIDLLVIAPGTSPARAREVLRRAAAAAPADPAEAIPRTAG